VATSEAARTDHSHPITNWANRTIRYRRAGVHSPTDYCGAITMCGAAGTSDPGYAFTIRLTTYHGRVGRGCVVGRGLGDGLGEE
jgi:hypothetical protein